MEILKKILSCLFRIFSFQLHTSFSVQYRSLEHKKVVPTPFLKTPLRKIIMAGPWFITINKCGFAFFEEFEEFLGNTHGGFLVMFPFTNYIFLIQTNLPNSKQSVGAPTLVYKIRYRGLGWCACYHSLLFLFQWTPIL